MTDPVTKPAAHTSVMEAAREIVETQNTKAEDFVWMKDAALVARALIRMHGALTEIAAFDDAWGNKRLEVHGTYSSFDEPSSVQIARAALEGEKP